MTKIILLIALALAVAPGRRAAGAPSDDVATTNAAGIASGPAVARGKGFEIHQRNLDQATATLLAKDPNDTLPKDAEARILSRLIEIQLVFQNATEAEKAAGRRYADERYAALLNTLGAVEVERRLHATGMTADEVRRGLGEEHTARESLNRQLGIEVTEADLKQYYEDNPEVSEQPEMARIRELLLLTTVGYSSKPLPAATIQAKHQQIFALYHRVRAGEDFATLARQYNEDPVSKGSDGVPPLFRARQEEFGDLALAMQPNQISGVLTNEDGYRIFQLLEKIPAKKFAFAAVTNRIRDYIIAGKTEERAPAYITQLRAAAGVEILDAGLKATIEAAELQAAEAAKAQPAFQAKLAAAATNGPCAQR